MLSLFNFITVHSSYVYLLRNQHKFCKISKNTFFTEHFWATASVNSLILCSDVATACRLSLSKQLNKLKHTGGDRCTHPLKFEQK